MRTNAALYTAKIVSRFIEKFGVLGALLPITKKNLESIAPHISSSHLQTDLFQGNIL
jgi:hypothetical protein